MHLDESPKWHNGYPMWLKDEIDRRQTEVDPACVVAYIQVGFLSPMGNVQCYRYYTPWKKKVAIEDIGRALRFTEDRFMMMLEKTGYVNTLVNDTPEVDLGRIRQKNFKKSSFSTKTYNNLRRQQGKATQFWK